MKKFLFLAIAAAAMTSCSQDEVMEVAEKQAISFGNAFVGNVTRATSASDPSYGTATPITSFRLYGTVDGVNIYNAVNVTKDNANYGAPWTCPVTQYWVDGADYKFAAVVNNITVTGETVTVNNGIVTPGDGNMPTSIAYTADGTTDLLYDEVERKNVDDNKKGIVAFEFTHLLAKAKFTLTNTTDHTNVQNGNTYTYDIKNLKITNTYDNATYNVGTGWDITKSTQKNGTEFGDISALVNNTPQVCEAEKLLIPGLTSVTISFEYDIKLNNQKVYSTPAAITKTVTIPSTVTDGQIKANCAYNFQLSVGLNTPIEFTVKEAPQWTNPVNDVTVEPEITQTPAEDDEEGGESGEGTDA